MLSRSGWHLFSVALLLAFVSVFPVTGQTQRDGTITVTVDGKKYLSGTFTSDKADSKAKIWFDALDGVALRETAEAEIVYNDETGEGSIQGKIIVDVEHAGKLEVESLTLSLAGETTDEDKSKEDKKATKVLALWHVDEKQIEDMAKQLKFERPVVATTAPAPSLPETARPGSYPYFIPVAIGAVLLVGGWLVLKRGRRNQT